jgi:hypothetical protein
MLFFNTTPKDSCINSIKYLDKNSEFKEINLSTINKYIDYYGFYDQIIRSIDSSIQIINTIDYKNIKNIENICYFFTYDNKNYLKIQLHDNTKIIKYDSDCCKKKLMENILNYFNNFQYENINNNDLIYIRYDPSLIEIKNLCNTLLNKFNKNYNDYYVLIIFTTKYNTLNNFKKEFENGTFPNDENHRAMNNIKIKLIHIENYQIKIKIFLNTIIMNIQDFILKKKEGCIILLTFIYNILGISFIYAYINKYYYIYLIIFILQILSPIIILVYNLYNLYKYKKQNNNYEIV